MLLKRESVTNEQVETYEFREEAKGLRKKKRSYSLIYRWRKSILIS